MWLMQSQCVLSSIRTIQTKSLRHVANFNSAKTFQYFINTSRSRALAPLSFSQLRTIGSCDDRIKKTSVVCDVKKQEKVQFQVTELPLASESLKVLQLPRIYATLSKWYLTTFVVMTADAGYCLAPVMFDHYSFFFLTLGTALCSCSANTLNQISEIKYDALMDRTASRPLVRKTITPRHALMFAAVTGSVGTLCLYGGTNLTTALLGFANIGLYAAVYTPMKRRHWFNTWVGSIVGAIPPVMGWSAVTGHISPGAFIFSGILYAWQFPHFYALAWRRKADYARGNYHMLPLSHPFATKCVCLAHSVSLWGLCIAAPLTGVTTWAFVGLSTPLNAWITRDAWKFYKEGNSKSAKTLYNCSLYYIMLISLAITIDRKMIRPYLEKNTDR